MELKEMFDGGEDLKPTQVTKVQPSHSHSQSHSEVCDALDAHISKCAHCRAKYMLRSHRSYDSYDSYRSYGSQSGFGGFDLDKIGLSIKSNKDIVTIFLFGLLVILLLQLFSK
jgi:hypothetical protein